MGQLSIHMFDVGGQRSERKKVSGVSRTMQIRDETDLAAVSSGFIVSKL
jgi:hypothetical protein